MADFRNAMSIEQIRKDETILFWIERATIFFFLYFGGVSRFLPYSFGLFTFTNLYYLYLATCERPFVTPKEPSDNLFISERYAMWLMAINFFLRSSICSYVVAGAFFISNMILIVEYFVVNQRQILNFNPIGCKDGNFLSKLVEWRKSFNNFDYPELRRKLVTQKDEKEEVIEKPTAMEESPEKTKLDEIKEVANNKEEDDGKEEEEDFEIVSYENDDDDKCKDVDSDDDGEDDSDSSDEDDEEDDSSKEKTKTDQETQENVQGNEKEEKDQEFKETEDVLMNLPGSPIKKKETEDFPTMSHRILRKKLQVFEQEVAVLYRKLSEERTLTEKLNRFVNLYEWKCQKLEEEKDKYGRKCKRLEKEKEENERRCQRLEEEKAELNASLLNTKAKSDFYRQCMHNLRLIDN